VRHSEGRRFRVGFGVCDGGWRRDRADDASLALAFAQAGMSLKEELPPKPKGEQELEEEELPEDEEEDDEGDDLQTAEAKRQRRD